MNWRYHAYRFLALFLVATSTAHANQHDHVYSLPSSASFAKQGKEILSLPLRSQELSRFFQGNREEDSPAVERLRIYLIYVVGLDETVVTTFLQTPGLKGSLADVAKLVSPENPEQGLKRMLAVSHPYSRTGRLKRDQRREVYVAIENIRRGLLLSISLSGFTAIFRDFYEREHVADRLNLDLSVPIQFYSGDQWRKLKALHDLNYSRRYPAELRFFLSVPRRTWLAGSTEPMEILKEFSAFNHQKYGALLLDGIDLSGSMYEDIYSENLSEDEIADRLYALFVYCNNNALSLRIHAFEAISGGVFYKGLHQAMKKMGRSTRTFLFDFRIGHINRLNYLWVNRFRKLMERQPNLKLSFEVNVASNIFLHNATIEELTEQILNLRLFKLPHAWGSDGRGILRSSSVTAQMRQAIEARDKIVPHFDCAMQTMMHAIFGSEPRGRSRQWPHDSDSD